MSTSLDVLSVMLEGASDYDETGHGGLADDMRAALSAVAELVAADREYDAAKARRIEANNRITRGDRSDDAFRKQASANHAYDRAVDRRERALRPFNGSDKA